MSWLGLDIGGANLKIADGQGYAQSVAFPLWRQPQQLDAALAELIDQAPSADSLAVTMTGELADCFATKSEGVVAILDAVDKAARGREIEIYLGDGSLVDPQEAREKPFLTSASNWKVLATFAGRYCGENPGMLIDIGSTTCDLVPIGQANVIAKGGTDPDRLATGELVYTGVRRSPVCAVVSTLPWQGQQCPVAQEVFATTQDAYLVLDELHEQPTNLDTADGRPFTKASAHARLARAICADSTMFTWDDAVNAAEQICEAQADLILAAASGVLSRFQVPPTTLVLSGQGEFLACKVVDRLNLPCEIVSLGIQLGAEVSHAACAHALAIIASERVVV